MNLALALTFLRILLSLVFAFLIFVPSLSWKIASLVVFLLAAWTDYWDGEIARRQNQVTNLGALMDPIADKVLVLSAFVCFVQLGLVDAWMVLVIFMRDIFVTVFRLSMPQDSAAISARPSGKWKTAFQFVLIVGILIYLCFRETGFWKMEWEETARVTIEACMFAIVFLTLWSAVRYAAKNRQLFR